MKILIVAGYFPPYSPNSAIRVNKLSKYLLAQGHDVKVLAPKNPSYPPILVPEIDTSHIIYTRYDDINRGPERIVGWLKGLLGKKKAVSVPSGGTDQKAPAPVMPGADKENWRPSLLSRMYMAMTNIPDNIVGWYPHAVKAAEQLKQNWRPDIIYATAPPFTSLLVASKVSEILEAPWVCEYRDLWSDHPYYSAGKMREIVDRLVEARILRNCAGLVTVTQTWADLLRERRSLPVEFVMNGYDPDDFQETPFVPLIKDVTTITYAGVLYEGKRDPAPLFEAVSRLGERAAKISLRFHVPNPGAVIEMARKYGVEKYVDAQPLVPYAQALEIMKRSDVLMLLRWDHPGENGVIAGKLFEYIGARRPILSIGSTAGEAADIIRDKNFGVVTNDVDMIGAFLNACLETKEERQIPAPSAASRSQYSRNTQFQKLEKFLIDLA